MELQKQHLKERVIGDSVRNLERRRRSQEQKFAEAYNKLKVYEFPSVEKINMEKYFNFIKFKNGFCLSRSALQIYPVLCSRANFEENKWFQLSRENIAKMAGVSPPTVSKGLHDLLKYTFGQDKQPFLRMQRQIKGKRHFHAYKVGLLRGDMIREWKGHYFIFHTCIIESGTWAALKPRAKLLYLAMRTKAYFDADLYASIELEGADTYEIDYQGEEFRNRLWDVCTTPLTVLCKLVRISPVNISNAVSELEKYQLAEKVGHTFKVYLKPRIKARLVKD